MKTCNIYENDDWCGKPTEGNTPFCASHNRAIRKLHEIEEKIDKKFKAAFSKKREPRATPARDPKKWKNTFLCSDGTRVTQAEINEKLKSAYAEKYKEGMGECEGCGEWCDSSAHVIPKARCKQIGKTELIWHPDNFFPADFKCNAALENPKGQEWKRLLNIDKCIQFIYEHDKELYFKFEAQGWQAKIKENETI